VLAEVETREGGASVAAASGTGERLQMCNPPFVHSVRRALRFLAACTRAWRVYLRAERAPAASQVAVGESDAAGGARYAAAACGDGSVALLALEPPPSPKARASWALTRAAGGHTACAAHACFPAFAAGAPLLLSAGNDGRALLWDWGAYVAGDAAAPRVLATAAHGAKINWATSGAAPSARLYLADTSPTLTAYDVRLG
jgi:hypothetical protein